jgi:hypothetical protein
MNHKRTIIYTQNPLVFIDLLILGKFFDFKICSKVFKSFIIAFFEGSILAL